jgi:hypothetical protein
VKTLEWNLQTFAASFDVGLLTGPAKEKAFILHGRRQASQFHHFLRRKKTLGDFLAREIRPHQLDVHSHLPSNRKCKQPHAVGMRHIELQQSLGRLTPQRRFALRAVVKFDFNRSPVQISPEQFAENSPRRNITIPVWLENETLRSILFVRRKRFVELKKHSLLASKRSPPDMNLVPFERQPIGPQIPPVEIRRSVMRRFISHKSFQVRIQKFRRSENAEVKNGERKSKVRMRN